MCAWDHELVRLTQGSVYEIRGAISCAAKVSCCPSLPVEEDVGVPCLRG